MPLIPESQAPTPPNNAASTAVPPPQQTTTTGAAIPKASRPPIRLSRSAGGSGSCVGQHLRRIAIGCHRANDAFDGSLGVIVGHAVNTLSVFGAVLECGDLDRRNTAHRAGDDERTGRACQFADGDLDLALFSEGRGRECDDGQGG